MRDEDAGRGLASSWVGRVNARLPDRARTRPLGYAAVGGVASAVAFELATDGSGTAMLGAAEPALVGVSGCRLAMPVVTAIGGLSTAAAVLATGGGQSAGREGPIVMLDGAVAAVIGDRLSLPPCAAFLLLDCRRGLPRSGRDDPAPQPSTRLGETPQRRAPRLRPARCRDFYLVTEDMAT